MGGSYKRSEVLSGPEAEVTTNALTYPGARFCSLLNSSGICTPFDWSGHTLGCVQGLLLAPYAGIILSGVRGTYGMPKDQTRVGLVQDKRPPC